MEILKKLKSLWNDKRPYSKRLILSAFAAFAAAFTFLFYGPLELVAFSADSLYYTYLDILPVISVFALGAFVLLSLVLSLLRGKIFNYALALTFSATVSGYLQGAVFNGAMASLTGEEILWVDKVKAAFLNLALWALILFAVILIMFLHRKFWMAAVKWVSLTLVVMQLVPAIGIFSGAYADTSVGYAKDYTLTTDGFTEFSENENIVIFLLDTLDYEYVQKIAENDPGFFDELDGFTSFTNATSCYSRTTPSVAHILSGCDTCAFTMSPWEYYKTCWSADGNNSLKTLNDLGYEVELYTSTNYLFSTDEQFEYVSNSVFAKGSIKNTALGKRLLELSAYRYAPTVLKPFFLHDTAYFNDVFDSAGVVPYTFNDSEHLTALADATASKNGKSFKFYHFYGGHSPYTLDESGNKSDTVTDAVTQTKGCFTKLFDVIKQMKEQGIYENSTIIISGDHGEHPDYRVYLDHSVTPCIMYKPSGSADAPLVNSDAPVSTDNIIPTVIKAAGGDSSSYGKALDEVAEDEEITRYHYCPVATENWVEKSYTIFEINGNAGDFSNWTFMGEFPHVAPY